MPFFSQHPQGVLATQRSCVLALHVMVSHAARRTTNDGFSELACPGLAKLAALSGIALNELS